MTKNQQEEKKQTNEPAHLDDPFKDAIQFDKKVIKQRAIKTAFAAGGTLAVAIPVTVPIYYAVTPFNLMPPDVVGAIGFVVGMVIGLNTGWNVGLKKGREVAARVKDQE